MTNFISNTQGSRRNRSESLSQLGHSWWLRLLIFVNVLVIHLLLGHSDFAFIDRFLAGLCGAITVNTIWSYFYHRGSLFPVIECVFLQFYIYFAMPVFFEGGSTMQASFHFLSENGSIRLALFATLLFFITFLIGWTMVPERRRVELGPSEARHIPLFVIILYGIITLGINVVFNTYDQSHITWYSSILFFLFSPLIAQLLLLFEMQNYPKNQIIRFVLNLFNIAMIIVGLMSSRLDYVIEPILALCLGYFICDGKVPKKLIVAAFAILLIFNPAKLVYRELVSFRTTGFENVTIEQKVEAWVQSISQIWINKDSAKQVAFKTSVNRFDLLIINATVISQVPETVPFAMGEPWMAIGIGIVPRFLWPDKPNMTRITSDRFNILFGMTTVDIAEVSTGAYPVIGDGFWNLGWAGIIIVALVMSVFWKSIYSIWRKNQRLYYVLPMLTLVSVRPIVAVPIIASGIIQSILACLIVIKSLEWISGVIRHEH